MTDFNKRKGRQAAGPTTVPGLHPVFFTIADPATLYFDPDTGYLGLKETQSWVFGTLLGETMHFSNGKIKQICVKPFAHGWHRFMAVIAVVSGYMTFHVQSFGGGVTFRKSLYNPPVEKKPKKVYTAPVQGLGLQQGVNSWST